MLVTSIQSRFRSVSLARATPERIASVIPSLEVPAISTILYVLSATAASRVDDARSLRNRPFKRLDNLLELVLVGERNLDPRRRHANGLAEHALETVAHACGERGIDLRAL